MKRTQIVAALAVAVALLCAAPAAWAHKANPNFLSRIDALRPSVPGVTVEVLGRDDQLELRNDSGRDVIVEGYEGEPYARVAADGTVALNTRSPAYTLNDDRFGDVTVPADADPKAAPAWKVVSGTGRFEWHDHRIHWMSKSRPPQVTDPDRRTMVQRWTVPIRVGERAASVQGTLLWTPPESAGPPAGALAGGAALVVLMGAAAVGIRRRRDRAAEPAGAGGDAW